MDYNVQRAAQEAVNLRADSDGVLGLRCFDGAGEGLHLAGGELLLLIRMVGKNLLTAYGRAMNDMSPWDTVACVTEYPSSCSCLASLRKCKNTARWFTRAF